MTFFIVRNHSAEKSQLNLNTITVGLYIMNDQRPYINVSIPLEFFPLVSSLLSCLEGFHFRSDEEIGSLILDALMADDTMPIIQSLFFSVIDYD